MSEYKVNDQVIHSREGLATIVSMTTMGEREYFIVHASRGNGENIYVPCASANSIIRPIMSVKEADEILLYMKKIVLEYNANTKQRRDAFKRRLNSGDVRDFAYLSRQLYFYKQQDEENSEVRLGPVDIDMLTFADNIVKDEMALTYEQDRDVIDLFIEKRIKQL